MSATSQPGWDVVSDEPEAPATPPTTAPTAPKKPAAQPEQNAGASDWDVTSDETDKPRTPLPPSATDFLLNQAPHSIYHAAQNLGHAVIHPIDTAWDAGKLVAGTLRAAARGAGMEMPDNEADQTARNFVEYAKNRWGGVENIKNALYHDPAGMLMDFSAAMSGAGGVLRGAGALSGVEAASTLGRVASTAGEITNPLFLPSKATSGMIRRLGPKPGPAFDPKTASFEEAFDPSTGKFSPDTTGSYKSPPEPAAFDPKNAAFPGEEAFDPKTGKFSDAPGGYKSPPVKPPKAPETMQDAVNRLRTQWGVKPPKSGLETPEGPAAAPPPQPTAAPPPKPAAQPAAPPPPPKPPAKPAGWSAIAGPLAGFGVTGLALEYVTHHVLGSMGAGFLAGSAIKYLPQLLKSEAGQQMLARIGPGSNAAAIAGVARDLVPALTSLEQSDLYQQSLKQQSVLGRAHGGPINPELARLQRLRLPGIHDMLQRKH